MLEDGTRLAPKAVFGMAAKRALRRDVRPGDFRGGDKTACFRAIEAAQFTIKRKEASGNASKKPRGRSSGTKSGGWISAGGKSIPPKHANLEDERATAPLTGWLIQAAMGRLTLTYPRAKMRLESECGFDEIFPTLVGRTAGAAMDRIQACDPSVPLLNVLLVSSITGVPGAGAVAYLRERYPREDWLGRRGAHKDPRWRDLIEAEAELVYAYRRWDALYRQVYGSGVPRGTGERVSAARAVSRGGEGPNHRALRLRVAADPGLVQRGLRAEMAETEVELPSGDRVDVVCYHASRTVAIEVKSSDSDSADLNRGVYQCVKYRAVLEAQDIRRHPRVLAWLVTEEPLPDDVRALARRLGVWTRVVARG